MFSLGTMPKFNWLILGILVAVAGFFIYRVIVYLREVRQVSNKIILDMPPAPTHHALPQHSSGEDDQPPKMTYSRPNAGRDGLDEISDYSEVISCPEDLEPRDENPSTQDGYNTDVDQLIEQFKVGMTSVVSQPQVNEPVKFPSLLRSYSASELDQDLNKITHDLTSSKSDQVCHRIEPFQEEDRQDRQDLHHDREDHHHEDRQDRHHEDRQDHHDPQTPDDGEKKLKIKLNIGKK